MSESKMEIKNINILIVDDDPDFTFLLKKKLKSVENINPGLISSVDSAKDSKSAIELTEKKNFDILFLDYRIEEEDGLDVLQKLREFGCIFPAILMTSFGDESLAVKAMKAGVVNYLPKDKVVSSNNLKSIIEDAIIEHSSLEEKYLNMREKMDDILLS
jgi:DNA-binding NtrC family response regulator